MTEFASPEIPKFHWADYLVFALSLLVSAFVGFFFGFIEKKQNTTKDFLVGGGQMKPFPVALSLLASFLSAPFIIGTPAEMYMYGTMYSTIAVGYILAAPITMFCFIPVFHKLNITSSYEYLELRFNGVIRMMGSLTFSLMMLLYMAVVVYAPATSFSKVTGLSTFITILGVGIICTFYTAAGGMKAVIWTDVIQMIIILIGLLLLVIKGSVDAGGATYVWNKAEEGGRIDFANVDPDPTARHTYWTQIFGGAFISLSILGTNQAMIQRYLSIEKCRDAQLSVFYALIAIILYLALVVGLGLVVYAYYYYCDPLTTGMVSSYDQLVPLFTMEVMGNLHGLPGLFSAAVFSATLSTLSSGVNALSAVLLIDIIRPAYSSIKGRPLSETHATYTSKFLAVFLGLATIGLAYLAPLLGDTLLTIALSLFGMVGGPLLGLFTLAIFFPCANSWGAGVGLVTSMALTFWISIGSIINPTITPFLPLRTDQCPLVNDTANITSSMVTMGINTTDVTPFAVETTVQSTAQSEGFSVSDIYRISYMWYGVISVFVCLAVGLIVSACTGGSKQRQIDRKLLFPYASYCSCFFNLCHCYKCCPEKVAMDTKNIYPAEGNGDCLSPEQDAEDVIENGDLSHHTTSGGVSNPAFDNNEETKL